MPGLFVGVRFRLLRSVGYLPFCLRLFGGCVLPCLALPALPSFPLFGAVTPFCPVVLCLMLIAVAAVAVAVIALLPVDSCLRWFVSVGSVRCFLWLDNAACLCWFGLRCSSRLPFRCGLFVANAFIRCCGCSLVDRCLLAVAGYLRYAFMVADAVAVAFCCRCRYCRSVRGCRLRSRLPAVCSVGCFIVNVTFRLSLFSFGSFAVHCRVPRFLRVRAVWYARLYLPRWFSPFLAGWFSSLPRVVRYLRWNMNCCRLQVPLPVPRWVCVPLPCDCLMRLFLRCCGARCGSVRLPRCRRLPVMPLPTRCLFCPLPLFFLG